MLGRYRNREQVRAPTMHLKIGHYHADRCCRAADPVRQCADRANVRGPRMLNAC